MSIETKRWALRRLKLQIEQTMAEMEYMEGVELMMAVVQLRMLYAHMMQVRSTPATPTESTGIRLYIK